MRFPFRIALAALIAVGAASGAGVAGASQAEPLLAAPSFELDAAWPKVPAKWKLGNVSSVAVDERDHVWIIQRPQGEGVVPADKKSTVAPPVMEFDAEGNFLQAWGGPGNGYEWPQREHGIHLDYRGNVWVGGNYCPQRNLPERRPESDDQLLKFSKTGKFVRQVGHSSKSRGNSDTANLHLPADAFVYRRTNELFVADGYINHRVIVLDAETGAFKRMWGAFGNKPIDAEQCPPDQRPLQPFENDGTPGPAQFDVVHSIKVSDDGLVYVADRQNNRVQVFRVDGKYVTQAFIGRETPKIRRTASGLALSRDSNQQFLFVSGNQRIAVLDRKTLKVLSTFADNGVHHHIALDSKGNLYSARLGQGKNIEKYVGRGSVKKSSH